MTHEISSPSAERNVLGLCLKNPDLLVDVEGYELSPQHFGIDQHRNIFTAMMYLYSKGMNPSPLSIMEVIVDKKAKEEINKMGGLQYLDDISQTEVDKSNLKIFCQKVRQTWARRELYNICEHGKEYMLSDESETKNPTELVSEIEAKVMDIASTAVSENGAHKMGEGLRERMREKALMPSQIAGLEVGWDNFDYLTNGAQPGDMVVVVARAKCGKSVVLTTWAKKIAIEDKLPVLYIDTEMSAEEQEERLVSMISGVDYAEVMNGLYAVDTDKGTKEDKIKRVNDAITLIEQSPYYHVYMPTLTLEKVQAVTKQHKAKYDICALFFDYIKIPSNNKPGGNSKEYQELGYLTTGIKELCGSLGIPCFTACQENRNDVKGVEKDESSIGCSDRILQYATKLCFFYRKTDEQIARDSILLGNRQIKIAFQRNGESNCDPINIDFDGSKMCMREV